MRLIDADAKVLAQFYDEEHEEWEVRELTVADYLSYTDTAIPFVDVPDRKVGKWIDKAVSIKGVPTEACSVCGEWSYGDDMSYCPNCGARMENNAEEIL